MSDATYSASSGVSPPPPAQQTSSLGDLARCEDDIETSEVFYTATPGYVDNLETPGRLDPSSKYGGVLR
jgi:hypothetical protein